MLSGRWRPLINPEPILRLAKEEMGDHSHIELDLRQWEEWEERILDSFYEAIGEKAVDAVRKRCDFTEVNRDFHRMAGRWRRVRVNISGEDRFIWELKSGCGWLHLSRPAYGPQWKANYKWDTERKEWVEQRQTTEDKMSDHERVVDTVSGIAVGKKGGVLLPYNEGRPCPKCRHSNTEDTYIPEEDLLHRGCCRCHHGWRELPLDR